MDKQTQTQNKPDAKEIISRAEFHVLRTLNIVGLLNENLGNTDNPGEFAEITMTLTVVKDELKTALDVIEESY